MRIPAHILTGPGLAGVTFSDPIPPDPGVSVDTAKQACAIAQGTWDDAAGGCRVPDYEAPPSWCGPFGGWIFDACTLPSAADLTKVSSYTAYKIAQKPVAACQITYRNGQMIPADPSCTTSGADAAQTIMTVATQQSQDLAAQNLNQVCGAAASSPQLTALFGGDLVCDLADPFHTKGWMIYAAIGVGAALVLSILMGGRR